MNKEDVARGISVVYEVGFDEALEAVKGLHEDINTCIRHIHASLGTQSVSNGEAYANARKETGPLSDENFQAMWDKATWLVAKGC